MVRGRGVRKLLKRTQEIQQVLFLLVGHVVEDGNDSIRFRTGPGVSLDGFQQTTICRRSTSVVEEEYPLTYAPQRRRAELIRARSALRDVVGKTGAHVMHEQVGIESRVLLAQSRRQRGASRLERRGVAHVAVSLREYLLSVLNLPLRGISRNSRS